MRSGTIAFFAGTLIGLRLTALPDLAIVQLFPVLVLLAFHRWWRLPALAGIGLLWFVARAGLLLAPELPVAWEGRDLRVEGTVASLVDRAGDRIRFVLDTAAAAPHGEARRRLGRIRLTWYGAAPRLEAGETWGLTVRLKRPHGFMNPGGFDYEGWLFRRGIRAVGYVRANGNSMRLRAGDGYWLTRLRQRLVDRLEQILDGAPYAGIAIALTVGSQRGITPSQWSVLRRTGTSHLVAISGLHIGLVSGLAFVIARRLWSVLGRAVLLLPAPTIGALAALAAAVAYAGLAGFSVPTQRALAMVAVVMFSLLARRSAAPSFSLAWALLLVLVVDPLAGASIGSWLSFGAVAVLLYGLTGRTGRIAWWWRWGSAQWLVAVGLLPLILVFFPEGSLTAPLVNLLAVPWTGIAIVPPLLLGAAGELLSPGVGAPFVAFGQHAIGLMWLPLRWIAGLGLVYGGVGAPAAWAVGAAVAGVPLLLAPRGVPGRWLGLVFLLPLLASAPARPPERDFWITLLDVGQGLAAVVQTRRHTLVFDTGPRFGPTFDAGRAAVLPYLRHAGIDAVDTLVLSHANADHIGGAKSLLASIPVATVITGTPIRSLPATRCRAGTQWRWDGVAFRVLNPPGRAERSENDGSCVLRVEAAGGTLLLTGDIERAAEARLVRRYREALRADVLVVPHHGSKTSSGRAFVAAVDARYALLSVGYRNRYRFPHPAVLARYRARGTRVLDTATGGAITLRVSARSGVSPPARYRVSHRRFWHDPGAAGGG